MNSEAAAAAAATVRGALERRFIFILIPKPKSPTELATDDPVVVLGSWLGLGLMGGASGELRRRLKNNLDGDKLLDTDGDAERSILTPGLGLGMGGVSGALPLRFRFILKKSATRAAEDLLPAVGETETEPASRFGVALALTFDVEADAAGVWGW